MERKILIPIILTLVTLALVWAGYRAWHNRMAGVSRPAIPANRIPGPADARPPAPTQPFSGHLPSQSPSGNLPNRSSTQDVQRTLRTIDEINRINKLNRDQNVTSKRK